jgi:hypothetical protein
VKTDVVSVTPGFETRDREFISLAKTLAAAKGQSMAAVDMARARRASPRVVALLEKAATDPGFLGDPSNWADPLAQSYAQIGASFVESLRHDSVFDTIAGWNGFRPVPLRTRTHVISLGATGGEVGEAFSKPVSKLELESGTLEPRKTAAMLIVTDELARSVHPAALELFGRELRAAVGSATDETFLAELAAADGSPVTTAGDSAANALTDLSAALASIPGSSQSHYVAVIAPGTAKSWAFFDKSAFQNLTALGGFVRGLPILISGGLPTGVKILLVDANQIAASPGTVVLDGSSHATLALSDASTEGPQTLTNLWQKNLRAIRAERQFGFELLQNTGVAVIEEASE